jgi:hypothetical protein
MEQHLPILAPMASDECSKLYLIRGRFTNTKIQSEALTDKESAEIGLAHLSSDPKYSNALPLRLCAACVPYALHPTDEFDAPPSVRTSNLRTQECSYYKGPLRFDLADIEGKSSKSLFHSI